jgi:hypothetical protein
MLYSLDTVKESTTAVMVMLSWLSHLSVSCEDEDGLKVWEDLETAYPLHHTQVMKQAMWLQKQMYVVSTTELPTVL